MSKTVFGMSKDPVLKMVNGRSKRDKDIRVLRTRFESYIHTFGRDAIVQDLAQPADARKILRIAEMADCATLWLNEATSSESSEWMVKVLMVAAVVECSVVVSMNFVPLLPWV